MCVYGHYLILQLLDATPFQLIYCINIAYSAYM